MKTSTLKKYSYQNTDYPNIFKNVYWGHHFFSDGDGVIAQARNKFIADFNIQKVITPSSLWCSYLSDGFDHKEYYRCSDGRALMVNSPYVGTFPSIDLDSRMKGLGFEKINKLYDKSADTYLKKFESIRDMNKWLKKSVCRDY